MNVRPDQRAFAGLQRELLNYYGVHAVSRFVELRAPPIRAHVLDAGEGEPAGCTSGPGSQA